MTLPQELSDKIKADAENYAGVMVWVNKNPKGEEQLFYEYIAATSHQAGATEWAGRAQPVIDFLEEIGNGPFPINQKELEEWLLKTKRDARTAIAKYKEVSNG